MPWAVDDNLQFRKPNLNGSHLHIVEDEAEPGATTTALKSTTTTTSAVTTTNRSSMLPRATKGTTKLYHNHRRSNGRSTGVVGNILLVSGLVVSCVILLVKTNFSALSRSPSSALKPSRHHLFHPDRMWKPHGHLEGTDYSLTADDGLFFGIYQFRYGPYCSNKNQSQTPCSITFPVENINVCTASSCLVTQRGQKALPPMAAEDLDRDNKNHPTDDDKHPNNNKNNNNNNPEVPNQDKVLLVQPFASSNYPDFFLAVLADGHGPLGHASSEIASQELPPRIVNALQSTKKSVRSKTTQQQDSHSSKTEHDEDNDDVVPALIRTAFLETDQGEISTVPQAGTTAIAVLQMPIPESTGRSQKRHSRLYVASTGDSTALVIQWKPSTSQEVPSTTQSEIYRILGTTVHHKPGDPKERARIEANGGTVYIPWNPSESSRVIYTIPGPPRIQMGLAMSRSLGDADAKRQQLIIPDPDIITIDFIQDDDDDEDSQYFVILATDGVMDHLTFDEVIVPLGKALFDQKLPRNGNSSVVLYETCQSILEKAESQWAMLTNNMYRDDMSLVVKKIEFAKAKK
jgi:serine/threonine protein phosphatase PrpC